MGFPFLQSTALLYDQFIGGQNQFINDQEYMMRKILIKRISPKRNSPAQALRKNPLTIIATNKE